VVGDVPDRPVRRRRRSRRRRLVPLPLLLAGLVLLAVAVAGIGALHLLDLGRRLEALKPAITAAETAVEDGHIATAQGDLDRLQSQLTSVNSALYDSPDLEFLDLVPVARQNLAAIRSATSLGLRMVGGGEQILRAAAPLEGPNGRLDVSLHGGQVPLATTEAVATVLGQVAAELPASAQDPSRAWLVGRVRRGVDQVYAEAASRRSQLQAVGSALTLVDDMAGADGPRRYLIAIANTAEMRGTGGMILSYGVLQSSAGRVSLAHVGGIDELALSEPETAATFPAPFNAAFGDLDPTQDWRNANIYPDFTVVAPVLEAMYQQATGQPVDGVLQVDPEGLASILAAIGPVQTPDLGTVTAQNVVPLTLNQEYTLFPDRPVRQDYTQEAAKATFTQLTTGSFPSLRPLGTELLDAALARHLLFYANDPGDEAIARQFGFAGALPAPTVPYVELSVQNVGANKLDYYLATALSLNGPARPAYIFGSDPPGTYRGLVLLFIPPGSALLGSTTDPSVTLAPQSLDLGGTQAVYYTVAVPAGGTSTVTLHLFLAPTPDRTAGYVFVPDPRVIPTVFHQQVSGPPGGS
jgi:hypothetical protein